MAELRAGVWRIRERWEAALRAGRDRASWALTSPGSTSWTSRRSVRGPDRTARRSSPHRWFAPAGARDHTRDRASADWSTADEPSAGSLPAGERLDGDHTATGPGCEIDGVLLARHAFDLVTALEQLLAEDCADFPAAPAPAVPEGSIVLGDAGRRDLPRRRGRARRGVRRATRRRRARGGRRGPAAGPGSRARCYVGAGTRVLGGFLRGSVFGPECRVRGEVAAQRLPGLRQQERTTASSATASWATG